MLTVLVTRKHQETDTICVFELVDAEGRTLPPFTAGAHIDVHLNAQLIRQYSLCNSPRERHRYLIAVQRETPSRGGSQWMHEQIEVGQRLTIGTPRNLFELQPPGSQHVLIGAGIGITPLLSMAHELALRGDTFELHYRTRDPARSAFLDQLTEHFPQQLRTYFDRTAFNDATLPGRPAADKHLYVCGPQLFMEQMIDTARRLGWAEANLHREVFNAKTPVIEGDQPFEVEIASTGAILQVAADQTVHQVLDAAGIDVPISCGKGICGACLTGVRAGIVDHRDQVLSEEEQAQNDLFTPCCSRAFTPRLVLDL
ncbi:MAG TPA: PDR/VanB family oxidoreductase [Pseudomonas sp.]|uniref:PDR/VanB family oxidoreductase n=1 Tax=Pseudomonas sp. TaxID=306 RepID=UPI002EDB854E